MIPISLSLSGFLSYLDPVEIDFSAFELACIAGANGSGKSSILDGITWALFGKARQGGEAIINSLSDQAHVIFVFSYEENIYRIQRTNPRGKGSLLEFHLQKTPDEWKPLTERTIRATQERIEEILRLDYEIFVNAAFFLQGKADQFTQQKASDRKRILANILGLEIWNTYRQRTVEQRKIVDLDIQVLDGRLTEINAELSEEQTRKTDLKKIEAELERLTKARQLQEKFFEQAKNILMQLDDQKKVVDSLSKRVDSDKKQLEALTLKQAAREKDRSTYANTLSQAEVIVKERQQWLDTQIQLKHWDQVAEKFREQERDREKPRLEIETEKARLMQEIKILSEQDAGFKRSAIEAGDFQAKISNLQIAISNLNAQLDDRKGLETELAAAQEQFANAKAENPRLKADMEALKTRIDQLSQSEGAACPVCEQDLNQKDRLLLIEELNLQGLTMGNRHRANRKLLDDAGNLVSRLKSSIADLLSIDEPLREHTRSLDQLTILLEQQEAAQKKWATEGAPRLIRIQKALESSDFAAEARSKLSKIDQNLKQIGYDAATHDNLRNSELEGRAIDDEFRNLEIAKAALEPLEREITDIADRIATLLSSCEQLQKELDQAKTSLDKAQAQTPEIRKAQRDLLDYQEEENRLRMDVGAARQKVQVLTELKTRRVTVEAEREKLALARSQYKQLETAFGKDGVPALLIEQALPQIEIRANDILERISGGELSIRFQTQRALKTSENLRETLDIQIQDRAGVRDYEMYSGGEAFRVNFAIRLALSEVLSQRAGARLQTLVIDEGFGSQDEIGRQRLIEAINLVKPDFAKILVITHIDSLKDAFPTRLEVEKSARGSVVRIV
ncbi:MAG: SMC family ATPase [Anaerolineae bacterium]|nr:SMC family ATPase [Anaerolineae bacterium]